MENGRTKRRDGKRERKARRKEVRNRETEG